MASMYLDHPWMPLGVAPPGLGEKVKEDSTVVCGCGAMYLPNSNFCAKCGAGRPKPSSDKPEQEIAEILALFKGLQVGAAQVVFDTVLRALSDSAEAAVAGINANMQTVACAMSGQEDCEDSVAGTGQGLSHAVAQALDAVGLRRAVALGGSRFSCHVGFHTHQQTICHLLHLIVQLTLFPEEQVVNSAVQAGTPFSAFACSDTQVSIKSRAVETNTPPLPPPPPKKGGSYVAVRIGGGFHLFQAPVDPADGSNFPREKDPCPRSPSSPSKPCLGDMAKETMRLSSTPAGSRPQTPRSPAKMNLASQVVEFGWAEDTPQSTTAPPRELAPEKQPFAFGARSDKTPADRYQVGAFVHGGFGGVDKVAALDAETKKKQNGNGITLYRCLRPASTHSNKTSPRIGSPKGSRPKSAIPTRTTPRIEAVAHVLINRL
eukprot:TRINITY_DN29135_c0_g1_i1.p1 TRINITY_DN29135_c0_g1~~TRINITY_DN29135_c0_g1_i1.p1  ORF type:complete len:447 (+),score=63.70 TRINITY_DN29135_c0_g1_i1:48-1343(+)